MVLKYSLHSAIIIIVTILPKFPPVFANCNYIAIAIALTLVVLVPTVATKNL